MLNSGFERSTNALYLDAMGLEERTLYSYDANYNVTALWQDGANGFKPVERYSYDPYGKVTVLHGAQGYDPEVDGVNIFEWMPKSANPDGSPCVSRYDNEILYCGYRFDWETGLYNVRYRIYHPTLGRWTRWDPAGYVDGGNLYIGFTINDKDPLGLWKIVRNNGGRADAVAEDGDTLRSLSDLLKFNEDEYSSWVMSAIPPIRFGLWNFMAGLIERGEYDVDAPICPGFILEIPNSVLIIFGKGTTRNPWRLGTMAKLSVAALKFGEQAKLDGFNVTTSAGDENKNVAAMLSGRSIDSVVMVGHGWDGGIFLDEDDNFLLKGRYVSHGLAFFAVLSCQSANGDNLRLFDPVSLGRQTVVNEWQTNVSQKGTFAGFVGNWNLAFGGTRVARPGVKYHPALRK